jgi:hypothetical protein
MHYPVLLASQARLCKSFGDRQNMSSEDPAIEPLVVLTVQTTVVKNIGATPSGDRTVVDVVSGTFAGPKLSGRIPATGGDWLSRTANRSRMDVRLLLETHDGVAILFHYLGRASQSQGKPRIEVSGNFDAPAGPYDWLNDVQAFGLGVVVPDGVRYHLFRFR